MSDITLTVGKRLFSDVTVGHLVDLRFCNLDIVTEHAVIAYFQSADARFFDFLATGGTNAAGEGTLQSGLAAAWGKLQVLFEDDEIEAVYFVNPLDVAGYLGTAQITTQTAFGMTYVENFLGLGTVFMNSSVPEGTIYATAKNNLLLYYVPANGADLNEAFSFTSDETGYVGIHEEPDYTNMTASTTMINGMELMAERLDGVVVGSIVGES